MNDDIMDISQVDLNQARQRSAMSHRILVKLKEMGISEELDGDLSRLCTDLGDIWSAQIVFAEKLGEFLESQEDWGILGNLLVDIMSQLDHVSWHLDSVKGPIEKISEYAYGRSK